MKKSELLKLIETLGDEDNVIDTLKDHEEIKSLAKDFEPSKLSLEDFTKLLQENETIKGYWTGEKDRAVSKGITGYEEKTLPKKIQEALDNANNKNKTPEQIEIEELKAKFEAAEKEKVKALNSSKYTKVLTEKGIDARVLDLIYSDKEEDFNSKVDLLSEIITNKTDSNVKEKILNNSYTPPSDSGGSNSLQSQIANAINGKI